MNASLLMVRVTLMLSLAGATGHAAPEKTFAVLGRGTPVGPNPCAIAIRDLNDDGLPDIITADRGQLADPREERPANDELSVLLAGPPLNYTRQTPSLKTDFGPWAIAVANVDGLKWPDIVVANFHAVRHRDITVFLNQKSEGIFTPVNFRIADESMDYLRQKDGEDQPLYTKPGLTSVAVQDINGDGLRDLLATSWSSDKIVFMTGHAEQYFANPVLLDAPGAPRDLRIADMDKDGKQDFVVVYYATSEAAWWRGDGKGGFVEQMRFPTRGSLPTTVRVADMNGDGEPDMVVSHCSTEDNVVIFYGDQARSFAVSQEIALGKDRSQLEQEIRDFVADDFNGDGRADLATACYASGEVVVLFNTSKDGRMPQTFAEEHYKFPEGRPRTLESADLDNDGNKDLAVGLWEPNALGILRNVSK